MDVSPLSDYPPRRIAFTGALRSDIVWSRLVLQHARAAGADTVIQLGNFGTDHEHFLGTMHQMSEVVTASAMRVLFIDGDQDPHDLLDHLPPSANDDRVRHLGRNCWYLPRGTRWIWDNVRFAAIGGASPVHTGARSPRATPEKNDWVAAVGPGQVDVFVMHECPAGTEIPGLDDKELADRDREQRQLHRRRALVAAQFVRARWVMSGHYETAFESVSELRHGPMCVTGLAGPTTTRQKDDVAHAVRVFDLDVLRHPAAV